MGLFSNTKAKEKLLKVATNNSIQVMSSYLKSRKKHETSLTIFDGPGMDNNINHLSETIYLMGVYDCLIRTLDNKFEILTHADVIGVLQAEMSSCPELTGYEVWLEQALKEGEYVPGSYQLNDQRIKPLNILFVAGQLSYIKFFSKNDGLTPDVLGLEDEYNFYDFKEFIEIKEVFTKALEHDGLI